MPAKRKDTPETAAALRAIFDLRDDLERPVWPLDGMELTSDKVDPEPFFKGRVPQVWIFRRQVRVEGTHQMRDTDPLIDALWKSLPEKERRRSRLFACCAECPVRFTKKGARADAVRHTRSLSRTSPPTRKEHVAAEFRRNSPPPDLVPKTDFEEKVAAVWNELEPHHRRTLYSSLRPTRAAQLNKPHPKTGEYVNALFEPDREWALEGARSPQIYASRLRSARRVLARALARRFWPGRYELPTAGRSGFDYDRFWADREAEWLG